MWTIVTAAAVLPMRLVTFRESGTTRVGVLRKNGVADVAPELSLDMLTLIERWRRPPDDLRTVERTASLLSLAHVELLSPIPRPRRNIFCVGKNYFEHARQFHTSGFDASAGNAEIPDVPIIFSKTTTTVIGPGADIPAYL